METKSKTALPRKLAACLAGCAMAAALVPAGALAPQQAQAADTGGNIKFTVPTELHLLADAAGHFGTGDSPVTVENGNPDVPIRVSGVKVTPGTGFELVSTDAALGSSAAGEVGFKVGPQGGAAAAKLEASECQAARKKTTGVESWMAGSGDEALKLELSGDLAGYDGSGDEANFADVTWTVGKLPGWSETQSTDAEVVEMVRMADDGKLDLTKLWSVGDKRGVTLNRVGETTYKDNEDKDVEYSDILGDGKTNLVLMNKGGYELTNGKTCNFVVQVEDCVASGGIKGSDTQTGSWGGSAAYKWCNSTFPKALPDTLLPIFKTAKVTTAAVTADSRGKTLETTSDRFFLPAAGEVFGTFVTINGATRSWSYEAEWNELSKKQWDWYATGDNYSCTDARASVGGSHSYGNIEHAAKKIIGGTGSTSWWLRSPSARYAQSFCGLYCIPTNFANDYRASVKTNLAPAGCI